jgi:hypothetical protein
MVNISRHDYVVHSASRWPGQYLDAEELHHAQVGL